LLLFPINNKCISIQTKVDHASAVCEVQYFISSWLKHQYLLKALAGSFYRQVVANFMTDINKCRSFRPA